MPYPIIMTDGLLLLFLVLLSKLQPSYYYVCYYCCYIHSDYHHLKYYDCYYCYSGRDRIKITINIRKIDIRNTNMAIINRDRAIIKIISYILIAINIIFILIIIITLINIMKFRLTCSYNSTSYYFLSIIITKRVFHISLTWFGLLSSLYTY